MEKNIINKMNIDTEGYEEPIDQEYILSDGKRTFTEDQITNRDTIISPKFELSALQKTEAIRIMEETQEVNVNPDVVDYEKW